MSRCIRVREQDGAYEIQLNAEPEDWRTVFYEADRVEHIEDLTDAGEWTAAYRIQLGGETVTYFVAEEKLSAEAKQALAQAYDLLLELAHKSKAEKGSEDAGDWETRHRRNQLDATDRGPSASDEALRGEREGSRGDD
jgi:hypothetical protein